MIFGGTTGNGCVCDGGGGDGGKRRWMIAKYSTCVLHADAQYFKDKTMRWMGGNLFLRDVVFTLILCIQVLLFD